MSPILRAARADLYGTPDTIVEKLIQTMEKINKSKDYHEFMGSRGFGVEWAPGAEFAAFMEKSNNDLGAVMKAVGIAK